MADGRVKVTPTQIRAIETLVRSGHSFSAVGRILGLPHSTVSRWAQRAGMHPPGPIDRAKVLELRQQGHTVRAIAESVSCSIGSVFRILAEYEAAGVRTKPVIGKGWNRS